MDIEVSPIDETFIRIDASEGILRELSEHFTFFAPGFQYSPAFRDKKWDGRIRLLRSSVSGYGKLYRGLVPYVEAFGRERSYSVSIDQALSTRVNFSLKEADDYQKSLKLRTKGVEIEARDYQIEAFAKTIRTRRSLIVSPTASGKSLVAYLFVRYFLDNNLRGVIIVPTTSLVEQLYTDFQDYSSANGFDVAANVHKVYSGFDKNTDKPVIISTWQSMYEMPEEYFEDKDFVIGDEAHLFAAKSLISLMSLMGNAKFRIGMTGTLKELKVNRLVLEGLFGPTRKMISTKELQDRGELAKLNIKCLILNYPELTCKMVKELDYQEEINFLIGCDARNKFIANLVLSLHGNTMVLFQRIEDHGQKLYDMIEAEAKKTNRKVFFIHGKVETLEREQARAIIEGLSDGIICASFGTFSTGINIKNLHNIVFASPTKSKIRSLQSIGRGLRKGDSQDLTIDNDQATLYDIVDNLKYKKHMNYTLKHFVERVDIYNEERFPYKTYNIEMKV